MSKRNEETGVDLSESSIYGDEQTELESDDVATEERLDRLETLTGGADDPPEFDAAMGKQFDELNAETEEELDALQVNLLQDDDARTDRDGSGVVTDDVAEERIAEFTEVGPASEDRGGISVAPGRDDTSAELRRHRPHPDPAGTDAIVEGNIDEPLDEDDTDRKVDEGTGA